MHLEPVVIFALIGVLGIGSQWLAWRLRLPAIVLMLVAGLLAGPGLELINPAQELGDLFKPVVAIAVAVILFEGGLTLNFHELRETGPAVKRLVFLGAPLAWIFSTAAIYFGAGLSFEASVVFGGILIVTGPTVVTPLLRQAQLSSKPSGILRWEAIVNDPVGALAAVLAYEVFSALSGAGTIAEAVWHLTLGISVALVVGYFGGKLTAWAFRNGHVPEYMKVPVLFALVLAVYAATDTLLHESGLLAVTVMGIVLANAHLPSFTELRRFKEHITVILVSGVFIMLAASLERSMIAALDWRTLAFVLAIMFLARPIAVWLSLIGTDLTSAEKGIIAWIGPRGVVAVAVSGLFGARLVELGVEDAAMLAPLAFAIVTATVLAHGFSIGPLARAWGLTSTSPPGVMIVGSDGWTIDMARELKEAGLPVLLADRNYFSLWPARDVGLPVFHGEILSEAAEHSVAMSQYGTLIAATNNDAYNALICTDFGPEFGRGNVFQVGRHEAREGIRDLPATLGGRTFGEGKSFENFASRFRDGWTFVRTNLTEEYPLETYLAERENVEVVAVLSKSGKLQLASGGTVPSTQPGDSVLAFAKRDKDRKPNEGDA